MDLLVKALFMVGAAALGYVLAIFRMRHQMKIGQFADRTREGHDVAALIFTAATRCEPASLRRILDQMIEGDETVQAQVAQTMQATKDDWGTIAKDLTITRDAHPDPKVRGAASKLKQAITVFTDDWVGPQWEAARLARDSAELDDERGKPLQEKVLNAREEFVEALREVGVD